MKRWMMSATALAVAAGLSGCLGDSGGSSSDGVVTPPAAAPQDIELSLLGRYSTGAYEVSAAEIPAFDPVNQRIFMVNARSGAVDVLDASNPATPTLVDSLATDIPGATINSVAWRDGLLAVAVEASPKTSPGSVELYDATTLTLIDRVQVGALPDMVTFTPDGRYVLVANEGEPSNDYSVDPEGSVSVVEVLADGSGFGTARVAGFGQFEAQKQQLIERGVRIYGPGDNRVAYGPDNLASVARDMEPEYITVSPTPALPGFPCRKTTHWHDWTSPARPSPTSCPWATRITVSLATSSTPATKTALLELRHSTSRAGRGS